MKALKINTIFAHHKRLLSFFMCIAMLIGSIYAYPAFAFAKTPTVTVMQDGKAIEKLTLPENEKTELTAECSAAVGAEYQWQISADLQTDTWVNIYDGTEKQLTVSYALMQSLLDMSGSTYIRCRASVGEEAYTSSPVCVTVEYMPPFGDSASVTQSTENKSVKKSPAKAAVQANEDEYWVDITVNYLDGISALPIYNPYTGRVNVKENSYKATVISPTYLGYAPYYNKADPAKALPDESGSDHSALFPDSASAIELNITTESPQKYVINVYYFAIHVPYAVRYYFQNIHDDLYTENASFYKTSTAKTGTIISNEILEGFLDPSVITGFTKLYHYPEAVSADGSTVFECYYDRRYFMLNFDADGGYGSEPIYARYGTPFLVNDPTRHGYVFAGWDLLNENGVGDGNADPLPSTIPNENQSYRALWERTDTTYHVAYWLQNADDDDYAYIGAVKQNAKSNDTITAEYIKENLPLTDTLPICGDASHFTADGTHIDNSQIKKSDCCFKDAKHSIYDEEKNKNTEVTVEGDGSTVINVYYTRKYYTLRFFYAKEYNSSQDRNSDRTTSFEGVRYSVVGGSTYGFGNMRKAQGKNFYNSKPNYTLDDLFKWLQLFEGDGTKIHDKWGVLADHDNPPKVNDPANVENAHYQTGVYPAEGEGYTDEKNPTNGNYDQNGDRYYYFDLTARYGADLTNLWPVDVFGKLEIADADKRTNGAQKVLDGWGKYAYPSGWNGEYKVQYSIDNENSTVKGLYQKLNDTLLIESYDDETRKIKAKTTVGGKEVDSNVCYYINFFDNGANVSWSVPRQWVYECYVPVFDDEVRKDSDLYNAIVAASQNEIINYTCTDGKDTYTFRKETDSRTYTDPKTGNVYYYYGGQIYRLYNKNITNDDNVISNSSLNGQTPTDLNGFAYSGKYEQISNGLTDDRRFSFTSRFFYTRDSYTLTLHSHNSIVNTYSMVFDAPLNSVMLKNGELFEPPYPTTLEENAYEFDGWYLSPECIDGTEYNPASNSKMPAENIALYAKWKPKTHTVRFFKTYEDMLRYETAQDTTGQIGDPVLITHGQVIESVKNPTDDFTGFNYTFYGWFYMKAGKKTAYTPLDSPVLGDMNVFADWGSLKAQPYLLHYALYNPENSAEWLALLNAAAGSAPKNNSVYTVTNGNEARTYIYLESDSGFHLKIADDSSGFAYEGSTRTFTPKVGNPYNQLYADYNKGGYYPTLASHSITMVQEASQLKPEKNVFTFTYVYKEEVEYSVEYRYADTNQLIPEDQGGGIKTAKTGDAVVTERFKTIIGYVPDAFFKRLILSVVKDESGEFVASPSNVIVFYYSKNTTNAYYAVHYMLQNLKAGTALDKDDDGNYINYTESAAHTEGVGTVGSPCQIPPQTFSGFEVSDTAYVTGDKNLGDKNIEMQSPDNDPYFEITVSENGTELYIFYTRTKQEYTVYYLDYGTDISNMPLDKNAKGVLEIEGPTEAVFGDMVTVSAASKSFAGRTCISPLTQSLLIKAKDEQNYLIFYYTPMQQTIEYKVWSHGGGTLDTTLEVFEGASQDVQIKGSTATALNGYEFKGWYLDEACTVPVPADKGSVNGTHLLPYGSALEPMPKTNVFYAKFTPINGSLTIIRQNGEDDESNGKQVFVYKIQAKNDPDYVIYVTIAGNGSVTVNDLPCREYTVEQQNGWSWRYGDKAQDVTVEENKTNSVTFYKADDVKKSRLNGNSERITNTKKKG